MADLTHEAAPPWARGMVAALGRGDHAYVLRTADLAVDAAADDPALLARVHTWIAQAEAARGDLDAARDHIRLAIRAVKQAGDDQGLAQIRTLRRDIIDRARGRKGRAREAAPPTLPPPPQDTALGRALRSLARGDHSAALAQATRAREAAREAGDPKAEVLALLAMARLPGHADAALLAAREIADLADDMNLAAAVAREARELGIDLGTHVF